MMGDEGLEGVAGRADTMPLADMARAEAFRNLARCIRDAKQIRQQGFGKDATLEDVVAWHERHIAALESGAGRGGRDAAWFEMIDTRTGERKLVWFPHLDFANHDDAWQFNWRENDYSCDCNRRDLFTGEEHDLPCTEGRYRVPFAYTSDGRVVEIDPPEGAVAPLGGAPECACICHSQPGVTHVVACSDTPSADPFFPTSAAPAPLAAQVGAVDFAATARALLTLCAAVSNDTHEIDVRNLMTRISRLLDVRTRAANMSEGADMAWRLETHLTRLSSLPQLKGGKE